MADRSEKLFKVNQVKARPCTRLKLLAGGDAAGEKYGGEAWDIGPMHLLRHHENPDFKRLTVVADASQKHMEAAFVGAQRIEKKR